MRADTRLPPYLPYPRFLLQADLTQTAKLLYALLLDRATLSQSNGWLDEGGRIYLVFPIEKIAAALDVSCEYLTDATMADASGILHALFELDDLYPWMHLIEAVDDTDEELPRKRVALCFDYNILNGFMTEWMLRKQQMRSGEITREEYQEWKLNWPQTADDCGKFEPKKVWRKSK